ncbi:septum site-determining protein MinD [bacterium BMS3Abin05]|nr:septum site-determining protein MinD [bacterium BMS3Abin05]GBE28297.1 septum site-determining protein MinD [bacterium BMS3Bbin03]HDZ11884.1 (4Fe-4S)-binding protein [Bacteroidota bacterium]
MKELVVVSGKGGTGKTTLTAGFAALAQNKVMADCNVEAADLRFLLNPTNFKTESFVNRRIAVIDRERCLDCRICLDVCRFDAISEDYRVNPLNCEGCRFCARMCPIEIIRLAGQENGQWHRADTPFGPLVFAQLGVAAENPGQLVALVRREAQKLAKEKNLNYIVIDGPAGAGGSANSAVTGVQMAVIVTEPTLSGIHELKRILKLTGRFRVPALVVVNKFDLNIENTRIIEAYCREQEIEVAGKIPYDPGVIKALQAGEIPVRYLGEGKVSKTVVKIWNRVYERLREIE